MCPMSAPGTPSRSEARTGLVLIAAWIALTGWQALFAYPSNGGGVYFRTEFFVAGSSSGVILVAAAVWLAGRSRVFRRS
jgi:hypothetical protein